MMPFITPSDMTGSRTVEMPQRFLSAKGAELLRKCVVERGVAVSCIGWQMGKALLIEEPSVTNQQINTVVPDRDDVDLLYLYYDLSARRDEIFRLGSGGSRTPILNKSAFSQLEVSLPPLDEQRRIAHILGTLDDKIELNRRMNRTLEAIAQAIFKSWFVDFDPVHAKAEDREPIGMDPETASLFPDSFQDSPLGQIPKGWEVKSLGNTDLDISTGKRPRGGVKHLTEGIPSIGAENVLGLGRYDYSKTKYVPFEFFKSLKTGVVNDRDVLLYKDGASLGRKSYFQDGFPFRDCCVNEHVFLLRGGDPLSQRYLFFWLDQAWMTEEIVNLNSNSAQPGINRGGVESLPLLVPPSDLVHAYDALVSPLFGRLFANCLGNRALEDSRDALLPRLLSGEVSATLREEPT